MQIGRALKRRAKASIAPVIFLSLVGYFGWNATRGAHGLHTYALREQQLTAVQAELAQAQGEQATWERRTAALSGARIDPDMLDEQSRAMLNLAEPNDIVVPYGPGKKLF